MEMEMEVRLYSAGLGEKLDSMEKNLTDILDHLNQIETEAESIRTFWNSPAYESWRGELEVKLYEVNISVRKMVRLLLAVGEIAVMLAEIEKSNDRAVGQLP